MPRYNTLEPRLNPVAVKGREGTSSPFTWPCQPDNVAERPALDTVDVSLTDRNVQIRTASLPAYQTLQTEAKWTFILIFFLSSIYEICSFYISQVDLSLLEFFQSSPGRRRRLRRSLHHDTHAEHWTLLFFAPTHPQPGWLHIRLCNSAQQHFEGLWRSCNYLLPMYPL